MKQFRVELLSNTRKHCQLLEDSSKYRKSHAKYYLILFNRDLNHGCLVYMFSLRFSRSEFLINLRRQFRVRKIFSRT